MTAPVRPLRPTRLHSSLDTALMGALMAGEIFQPAAGAGQLGRGAQILCISTRTVDTLNSVLEQFFNTQRTDVQLDIP